MYKHTAYISDDSGGACFIQICGEHATKGHFQLLFRMVLHIARYMLLQS